MAFPLIIGIITLIGLLAISTLKGRKATSLFHFAISILCLGNIALYESSGYQYSIFFDVSMVGIFIYELKMIRESRKI